MTEDHPDRYIRDPDVLERRCPDRVLVLAPTGDVQVLAGSATAVWDALTQPRTVEDIADELRIRFVDAPRDLSGHIAELVSSLVESRAIRIHKESDCPPS